MEVILVRDVPNLGREGERKKVAGGYARNYLIPRGLAVPATKGNLKAWEEKQRVIQQRAEQIRQRAQAQAQQLNGQEITLTGRTAPNSLKLFGAITADHIAEAIESQFGLKVDKRKIQLTEPIRTAGTYPVHIRWDAQIEAELTVKVEGQS